MHDPEGHLLAALKDHEGADSVSDRLLGIAYLLRGVAIVAMDTAVHEITNRTKSAVIAEIEAMAPLLTNELAGSVSAEDVRFSIDAAVGLVRLFGRNEDGSLPHELTTMMMDRHEYTFLLAAQIEVVQRNRTIAERGYVLRNATVPTGQRPSGGLH